MTKIAIEKTLSFDLFQPNTKMVKENAKCRKCDFAQNYNTNRNKVMKHAKKKSVDNLNTKIVVGKINFASSDEVKKSFDKMKIQYERALKNLKNR